MFSSDGSFKIGIMPKDLSQFSRLFIQATCFESNLIIVWGPYSINFLIIIHSSYLKLS